MQDELPEKEACKGMYWIPLKCSFSFMKVTVECIVLSLDSWNVYDAVYLDNTRIKTYV